MIPPLHDRREEIPIPRPSLRAGVLGGPGRDAHGSTPAAEQRMLEYSWPGNDEELRRRVQQAMALSEAPLIDVDDLFPAEPRAPS